MQTLVRYPRSSQTASMATWHFGLPTVFSTFISKYFISIFNLDFLSWPSWSWLQPYTKLINIFISLNTDLYQETCNNFEGQVLTFHFHIMTDIMCFSLYLASHSWKIDLSIWRHNGLSKLNMVKKASIFARKIRATVSWQLNKITRCGFLTPYLKWISYLNLYPFFPCSDFMSNYTTIFSLLSKL